MLSILVLTVIPEVTVPESVIGVSGVDDLQVFLLTEEPTMVWPTVSNLPTESSSVFQYKDLPKFAVDGRYVGSMKSSLRSFAKVKSPSACSSSSMRSSSLVLQSCLLCHNTYPVPARLLLE